MKLLLIVAIAIGAAVAAEIFRGTPEWDEAWKKFKSKHGKKYNHTVHDATRRKNWEAVRAKIKKHNAEAAAGLHTFTMAENHLSDLAQFPLFKGISLEGGNTHDSEKKKLTGYFPPEDLNRESVAFKNIDERDVADSVDLRTSACMPPVEDQGNCGSCWAFSATGALMYALCAKTGSLVRLSEQQLVDCSTTNYACNGGWFRKAWTYVKSAPGQATLTSYPYTAVNGTSCQYTQSMSAGASTGYVNVAANEASIRTAIATAGAVSASLEVLDSFQSYGSGVYSDASCPSDGKTTNHAIVLVGYGTQADGTKYWILRNSWGTNWGLSGYALIQRGVNMCNIESNVAYPTV